MTHESVSSVTGVQFVERWVKTVGTERLIKERSYMLKYQSTVV